MRIQTRQTLLLLLTLTLLLTLYPIGVVQGEPGSGTANLRVSLPAGTFINSSNPDPWLDEGWLLNLTGYSWSFTVRVTEISNAHISYDTYLLVALNNASYENILDLTVNGNTILKEAFQYGTPEPYNLGWTWPDGVYPTWFSDTYIFLGTIQPFEYKEVNVSATFSDPTDARIHFDAYGMAVPSEIQSVGDIIWSPNSEDSTVISAGVPTGTPHAYFTISPEPQYYKGDTLTFNASDSTPDGGNLTDPDSYFWDFGDGTNDTGMVVNHTYTEAGDYTITLNVTDSEGLWDIASADITVLNRPPVAIFVESAETVNIGEVIYFDASASYDLDGYIADYFWDFGDGTNATGVTVDHSYNGAGNYMVTLTVTDDDGAADTANSTKAVLEFVEYPMARFTVSPDPPYYTGVTLTFNASLSEPDGGTIVSYAWDFGDNTTGTGNVTTHAYAEAGTYTVTLNVTDSEGLWNTTTAVLTVDKRDIAVISVGVEYPWGANETYPGWVVNITVTVKNNGTLTENFDVTAYYNLTVIGTQPVSLGPGDEATLKFVWNTTGVAPSRTPYTIKANATIPANDANPGNNEKIDGTMKVKLIGDTDGDGDVDFDDVLVVAAAYLTIYPELRYDPRADFDGDGDVDFDDVFILTANYLISLP